MDFWIYFEYVIDAYIGIPPNVNFLLDATEKTKLADNSRIYCNDVHRDFNISGKVNDMQTPPHSSKGTVFILFCPKRCAMV